MKHFLPVQAYINPLGRTMELNEQLWMCYSATGAGFWFNGCELDMIIQGDDRCENSDMQGNLARIRVWVDDECTCDQMIDKKKTVISVLHQKKREKHLIRVMKVSETAMSTAAIKEIITDDDAAIWPEEKKEKLIEFAGDSITCGYGVDDEVAEHNFKTDTEDATKAYAYLTAKALDADYSMVSISGYGIISGYSGDGLRRPDQLLPDFYEKMGFSYGSMMGVYPQDVMWNFENRQPDVVVVNLGTNDQSFTRQKEELCWEYCDRYQDFLKTIRKRNPKAHILCILGIMGTDLCAMAEKAVQEYSEKTGDQKVRFVPFTEQLEEDGRAADYHPSQVTHKKCAAQLAQIVKEIL